MFSTLERQTALPCQSCECQPAFLIRVLLLLLEIHYNCVNQLPLKLIWSQEAFYFFLPAPTAGLLSETEF